MTYGYETALSLALYHVNRTVAIAHPHPFARPSDTPSLPFLGLPSVSLSTRLQFAPERALRQSETFEHSSIETAF